MGSGIGEKKGLFEGFIQANFGIRGGLGFKDIKNRSVLVLRLHISILWQVEASRQEYPSLEMNVKGSSQTE